MAQATAQLLNYHQSPRKVRLIADLVRGKSVDRALALLMTLPKRGAEPMEKLVRSAIANAVQQGATASDLVIEKIEVNGGIVFKRSMPRARGRSAPIRKKTSRVTLALGHKSNKTPKQSSGHAK